MTDDLRGWLRYQITAHRSTEAAERFVNDAMQHINAYADALTEQRVAAAVSAYRTVLQPFATAADDLDDKTKARSEIWELPAAMSITAGDLRRAREVLADRPAPEGAAPTKDYVQQAREIVDRATRRDYDKLIGETAAALQAARAEAREELLAQIREPSDELVEATAMAAAEAEEPGSWARLAETNLRLCKHDYREMQRSALDALADKLTEAK